jgi:hypothetical protein
VAHEVRDAEAAPGDREVGVARERLLEFLRGGLVAAAFQLQVAAADLGLGNGAGELGGGRTAGRGGL